MRLLFVCVENSCRSQIAEGIAKKMGHEAFSAGTNPSSQVNSNVIEVLNKMGINTSQLFPKSIDEFSDEHFDKVISMGCGVSCPVIGIDQDWQLEDPSGKELRVIEEIATTIETYIKKLELI